MRCNWSGMMVSSYFRPCRPEEPGLTAFHCECCRREFYDFELVGEDECIPEHEASDTARPVEET